MYLRGGATCAHTIGSPGPLRGLCYPMRKNMRVRGCVPGCFLAMRMCICATRPLTNIDLARPTHTLEPLRDRNLYLCTDTYARIEIQVNNQTQCTHIYIYIHNLLETYMYLCLLCVRVRLRMSVFPSVCVCLSVRLSRPPLCRFLFKSVVLSAWMVGQHCSYGYWNDDATRRIVDNSPLTSRCI